MRIRRRPLYFWLLLVLCFVLAAWWMLYVPYTPQRLFSVVPPNAVFISEHRDFSGRWDSFLQNPLTLSLLSSLGTKSEDLKEMRSDPQSRKWVEKLAARHLVLAYVPAFGDYAEQAWVFASWLGGGSQRMRWSLSWFKPKGFSKAAIYQGRPIWVVRTGSLRSDLTLSISFVEGMLVGCLSRHASTIYNVLESFDGRMPSVARAPFFLYSTNLFSQADAPDRGWIHLGESAGAGRYYPPLLTYELTGLTASGLNGRINSTLSGVIRGAALQKDPDGLDRVLGNLPMAVLSADATVLAPWLKQPGSPLWARMMAEFMQKQKVQNVSLAVLGGDYSGRFKGVRVPALVAGFSVASKGEAYAWMQEAFDRLNAEHRWGLVPREVTVGDKLVYAMEATTVESQNTMTVQEKPAYAVCGNWLLLASDLNPLVKLVSRFDGPAAEAEAGNTLWGRELREKPSALFGWFDLAGGQKTLRAALTTYSLKLSIEKPKNARRVRKNVDEAKAWVDSLAPLRTGRAWAWQDGDIVRMDVKIGD